MGVCYSTSRSSLGIEAYLSNDYTDLYKKSCKGDLELKTSVLPISLLLIKKADIDKYSKM